MPFSQYSSHYQTGYTSHIPPQAQLEYQCSELAEFEQRCIERRLRWIEDENRPWTTGRKSPISRAKQRESQAQKEDTERAERRARIRREIAALYDSSIIPHRKNMAPRKRQSAQPKPKQLTGAAKIAADRRAANAKRVLDKQPSPPPPPRTPKRRRRVVTFAVSGRTAALTNQLFPPPISTAISPLAARNCLPNVPHLLEDGPPSCGQSNRNPFRDDLPSSSPVSNTVAKPRQTLAESLRQQATQNDAGLSRRNLDDRLAYLRHQAKDVHNAAINLGLREGVRVEDSDEMDIPSDILNAIDYRQKDGIPNYEIAVSVQLYVNNIKAGETQPDGEYHRYDWDLNQVESISTELLKKRLPGLDDLELLELIEHDNRKAIIKGMAKNGPPKQAIEFEVFDDDALDRINRCSDRFVNSINCTVVTVMIERKVKINFTNYKLLIKQKEEASKKATAVAATAVAGPTVEIPSSPPGATPRHRTGKMNKEHEKRMDAQTQIGKYEGQLNRLQICLDKNCFNVNNTCWVDDDDPKMPHYAINHLHIEKWAKEIVRERSSIEEPSWGLKEAFRYGIGVVTSASKRPAVAEKKSRLDEIKAEIEDLTAQNEINRLRTEAQLLTAQQKYQADQMKLQQERDAREAKREIEQERKDREAERRQHLRDQAMELRRQRLEDEEEERRMEARELKQREDAERRRQYLNQQRESYTVPSYGMPRSPPPYTIPVAPIPVAPIPVAPQPVAPQPAREEQPLSSPPPRLRDKDNTEYFFRYVLESTIVKDFPNMVKKWEEAKDIAMENLWSLEDLRGMSEFESVLYKIAITNGIPDGIARRFKVELRGYKKWIRMKVAQSDARRQSGGQAAGQAAGE